MSWRTRLLTLLLALASASPLQAQSLLMVRSHQSFPETMLDLQTAIGEHGYQVSRVQRVDIGLTQSGFETDRYRIVFFGRPQEVRRLTANYPQLIPYLPQQITLFAEGEETLLVAVDPSLYKELVSEPEERAIFDRWRRDLQAIFDALAGAPD